MFSQAWGDISKKLDHCRDYSNSAMSSVIINLEHFLKKNIIVMNFSKIYESSTNKTTNEK